MGESQLRDKGEGKIKGLLGITEGGEGKKLGLP